MKRKYNSEDQKCAKAKLFATSKHNALNNVVECHKGDWEDQNSPWAKTQPYDTEVDVNHCDF